MPLNRASIIAQKHWIIGVVVALLGVLVVRGICPKTDENWRLAVMVFGHVLCLSGLFIIMRGVFHRHSGDEE